MSSHRLQVLISPELDQRIEKAAQRNRVSKGEWVRRALELSLRQSGGREGRDPLAEMMKLQGPTGDIEQILAEIERGRW
ncbi:MAG: CopG family transcriptional regulator [Acidobacteriota bacterium]